MSFSVFSEVKETTVTRFSESFLGILTEGKSFDNPMSGYDRPLGVVCEDFKHCPVDNQREGNENNGHWEGDRGDSRWVPNRDDIPKKANPDGQCWGEILDKHGIDSIAFCHGEADFSCVSDWTVEIVGFTDSRSDNFDRADIALAKQMGCSPEEVAKARKEDGYTWHECSDMKTMQRVPSEVHNNIPHSGGISEAKKWTGER